MTGRTARTAALARTLAVGPADGDLLAAFLDHRDEAAFAVLVRRHGPLVLSTCRHLLRDEAAAEDAFQATFVALVRKAAGLRRCPSLSGWLFGAARNCARHLRRAADRRARRERRAARPEPVPAPDLSWRDACAALHAEIGQLPDVYRLPLVLCYLQGLSREEAARRLGWSPDTVRGRLERGRRCLRDRLARRDITLTVGLLAAVATDAVSPSLVRAAVARSVRPPARIAGVAAAVGPARLPLTAGLATAAVLVGTVILATGTGAPPAADPPAKGERLEAARPAGRLDSFGDPLPDGAVARLGTVRFNHGDSLHGLLYTPDGKEVISVGNGTARIWDATTGAELRQFPTGRPDWDERPVLTPDGKHLVLVVQEFPDSLRVFDLASGKVERSGPLSIRRGDQAVARPNAVSADAALVAVWTQKFVRVFDAATAKELHTLPRAGESFEGLCFVGPELLGTAGGQKVELWEARSGKPVREFDLGGPAGVIAGSPDGKRLATLSHGTVDVEKFLDKDTVRLWDPATGKPGPGLVSRPNRWFMRIGFSPDSKLVWAFAQGRDAGEVTLWDATTGARRAEISTTGQVVAVSPDGGRLAAGATGGKFDVWDLATSKPTAPSELTSPWVAAVSLSRTGDRAITLGRSAITTWDTASGKPLGSPAVPEHLFEHNWCRISSTGRYALTVQTREKGGAVTLWDVATVKPVHTIPVARPAYGAKGSFSPDSTRLALRLPGKDAPITVHDLASWKEVAAIRPTANEYPDQFFFADDGRTLIVPGKRTVGYDLATGREAFGWKMDTELSKTNMGIGAVGGGGVMMEADRRPWRSFVVSPDGTLVACVLDAGWAPDAKIPDRIVLCDARTGKAIRRCGDSGRQSRGYEKLIFSPDGRLLASSDGYDIHIWEVGTGKEVRTLRGHRSEIEALAFSGNGRRLASASGDSTVLVWDVCPQTKGEPSDAWADLASADPAIGWATVRRMADDATIALLRNHLRSFTTADSERITKLVASLDSDEFRTRDRAFKELAELGHAARPALRVARDKKPSAEVADRLDQLLSRVIGPPSSGESLRVSRALAVLEAKGTSDARTLLKELAGGADGWLTSEATAAMKRLDR
jgi:RNA polymerase sigma factor (sigma-70 family)